MYLGIINGWSDGCIEAVSKKGLKWVEFCVNHNYDSAQVLAEADRINESCAKYGVKVGSIGRWGMDRVDDNGEIIPEALHHDKNCIDLASRVGCPVFNCGCNYVESKSFMENCDLAVAYLADLIEYGKERNVKIAVYNCDWENFVVEDPAWSVVLGRLPELGIKYDTSHCINRGGDYLAEMEKWGERFYHFHIKGTLYIGGEHYDDPPAGLDDVKWGPVFALLYIKKYNGMLSIEPHSGKWKGAAGQWGVDYTINFVKPFIMPEDYSYDENPYMP